MRIMQASAGTLPDLLGQIPGFRIDHCKEEIEGEVALGLQG
jgi:hypothetical protein